MGNFTIARNMKIAMGLVVVLAFATAVMLIALRLAEPVRLLLSVAVWVEIPSAVSLAVVLQRRARHAP
jgi:hypothetical protein